MVFILGIVSLGILGLTNKLHGELHGIYMLNDVNHEIQIAMLAAHHRLEETAGAVSSGEMDDLSSDVDLSVGTFEAMLSGGELKNKKVMHPLPDTIIIKIKSTESVIKEFKRAVLNLYESGISPAVDLNHDEIFINYMSETDALNKLFEELQDYYERRLNISFLVILILWSAIFLTAVTGLSVIEGRRKKAEVELKQHRENLMELVKERTEDLQLTNERLEKEISDRMRAEDQVKQMALFAELNPSPVLRFDTEGHVLMANQAASDILNMVPVTGSHITSLIPGMDKIDYVACIRDGLIMSHIGQIRDKFFHFVLRGLPDLGIGQIYGTDITEQKNAEAETLRVGQLASVGELAAGVAHEINNPINGIINFAQILADKTAGGSMENDAAVQIMHEGDRIAGIVSGLLSFARYEKDEKHTVDIDEVLTETLSLIKAQLQKEGILLTVRFSSDLPSIHAQFQQIEQIFLNLVNNARYTLNEKYPGAHEDKILEITGKRVVINEADYVQVIFDDHGNGIPPKLLDKIMNPFFTTKPDGNGTGLGLSITNNIVNRHGGSLRIDSREGQYTKVFIELPAITGDDE